jgi:hypothetical protein
VTFTSSGRKAPPRPGVVQYRVATFPPAEAFYDLLPIAASLCPHQHHLTSIPLIKIALPRMTWSFTAGSRCLGLPVAIVSVSLEYAAHRFCRALINVFKKRVQGADPGTRGQFIESSMIQSYFPQRPPWHFSARAPTFPALSP